MHPDLSTLRISLSVAGILLALGYHWIHRGDREELKRVYTFALAVCAVASFYLYLRLGPQFDNVTPREIMNPHDFYHYYIGSKYHEELGYFDLYECTVIADRETNRVLKPQAGVRDLRTYVYRRASAIADNPGHCMQSFSDERWEEFKTDISILTRSMRPEYWENVLRDKGYNATPIWTSYASVITNSLSIESATAHYALLSIDYLFVAVSLVAVGLTFGWRNSLFVILFWGTNFMTVFGFSRGSVSRLDWLACLIVAVYLIRRGRYGGAGVLAGISTGFRIFPVLFFFGLASKALWSLIRTRRIPARYLRFLLGFVVTLGLLAGLATLTSDGPVWRDFTQKITSHDEQIAGYRLGLKYALIDPGRGDKLEQWESRQVLRWGVIALALGAVFFAVRRLDDHLTPGLSFVCVVFMTAPTFYYYELLVVPFALFLPDSRRKLLSLGMGGFFGWCVLCYLLGRRWPLGLYLSYRLSWSLIALSVLTVALVFLCHRRGDQHPRLTSA